MPTFTYLLLYLSSEGAPYSEVADVLESIGFRPHGQGYDFVYDWPRDPTISDTLRLADHIHRSLSGLNVGFRIETSEG